MRVPIILLGLCLVAAGGCGKTKSTAELLEDLRSPQERERLIAVRLLAQRREEATLVVPALIEALKDKEADIRRSAALGLRSFGQQAVMAIPALQKAQKDRDARVSNAAATSLQLIDPESTGKGVVK